MSHKVTKCLRPTVLAIRSLCLALSLFTLLPLAFIGSPAAQAATHHLPTFLFPLREAQQATQDTTTLDLKTPLERELAGGQKHVYQITLTEGQYARVTVEQRGIDIAARISGPDAKVISEVDSEMRLGGQEKIELVADAAGNYRMDIEPKYKMLPAGHYQILLVELRTASEQDTSLQEARKIHTESARLYNAGKYEEAQPLVQRALEIRVKELGEEHPDTVAALNHLARIYEKLGFYDKAEQTNRRALLIAERTLGPEHPDVALYLHNLAVTYTSKEEDAKALTLHQRALEIREKVLGPDHPAVAVSLINMGAAYNNQGDKSKAVEVYQRALTIQEKVLGPENLNTGIVLNNLAKNYREMGEYGKAEPLLRRAVGLFEKLFGPDNVRMADSLTNLAILYTHQSDYAKAEQLFQRVLNLREKLQVPNHALTAQAVHNLASLYFFKGDYAKADSSYRRALELREKVFGPDHPSVSRTLNGLSRLLAMKGDAVQSVNLQQRANAITEREINLNFAVGSERQKLAYIDILPEQTNQTLSTHLQSAPNIPAAAELAVTTTLQRKGRVLDAMSDSFAMLRRRSGEEDRALLNRLNETTAELAKLVLNGPQNTTLIEHQKRIKTLEDEREKLESQISRRTAGFYTSSQPVSLTSIQAALPVNAALIEFAAYQPFEPKATRYEDRYGAPHYVAYIIRKQGNVQWAELGEAKAIDDAVDELRQALRDPKRKDVQHLARIVDERVMQPVRASLDDATQLLISPDGALNLIPFEALVDEQNRYLVERYSFSYLTSGRDLLHLQVARDSKSASVVLANPLFGEPELLAARKGDTPKLQRASSDRKRQREAKRQSVTTGADLSDVYFAPLSGTEREAKTIKSLFPEVTLLIGAHATEARLKQATAPRILHIATHGFFLTDKLPVVTDTRGTRGISAKAKIENPLLRSGLALAGANLHQDIGEDGILTALEASGLNLWGTKLVVLSACDTGLGEVKNGEGVYGLRRAFVLAGTETLVMSLWPVSDYVTREMMLSYYKGLKQGQGRGEALRQVHLGMLKRKGRQHPFYWASFIQSGEWANLDGKR